MEETNKIILNKRKFYCVIFCGILFLLLCALFGGYFWGKNSVKIKPQKPIYIKGDTIKIEKTYPVPIEVIKPCDTLNVIKECIEKGKYYEFFPKLTRDSLIYIPTSKDTLLIVQDWATERLYKETLYDSDTLGKAVVKLKTQYNRLTVLETNVVPYIKKEPYYISPPKISPFIGAGILTNYGATIQAGFFVNNDWGSALMCQYNFENKKVVVGLEVLYKF